TSPTSSIQRWSPVGTNIGGAATAGGCVGATSATGVEAGTTAGPGAGGRASVVVAFSADGLGCRGAGAAGAAGFVDGGVTTSCAGAAAGVGAEGATGAIGAGRTPCSWASAACALGPQPRATAVISCGLRPSRPSTDTRPPAVTVPSRRAPA